ncbi:hypothetical protein BST61_g6165 [Cercospora zeina]
MPSRTSEAQLSFAQAHDTFAAEVEGMKWDLPVPESLLDEIRAGADQYGVLIFRNANLNNDEQIRFSKQLGDLMDVKAHIKAGRVMRFPETPEIFDVSNLDDKGEIVTDADPARREGNKGNFIWHADMAYDPQRAKYSMLRAVELPPPGTGGETKYLDSRTAYADLPQETKDEIEPMITNNSLFHNRKLASPEFFAKLEPLDHPMARYRMVYPHEGDGRKNLYLTTYAHHLDGKTQEESQVIFDKLWAHLTQDKYIHTVQWKNNGDIVLWDNTAVLHKATSTGSYTTQYRRDMRRTTTRDDGKYGWGENEVGATWRTGIPQK